LIDVKARRGFTASGKNVWAFVVVAILHGDAAAHEMFSTANIDMWFGQGK